LANINPNSNKQSESVVEYEIVDENGNQIVIYGAEQLKLLAACVSEIRQPDGSVIKEYILNDPKVIEQIRNKISLEQINNQASFDSKAKLETEKLTRKEEKQQNNFNESNQNYVMPTKAVTQKSCTQQISSSPMNYNSNNNQNSKQLAPFYLTAEVNSKNKNNMNEENYESNRNDIESGEEGLSKVQQQIRKFQNKQSATPVKREEAKTNNQVIEQPSKALDNAVYYDPPSQHCNIDINKLNKPTAMQMVCVNQEKKPEVLPKPNNELLKKVNRHQFELKTRKGKALQFIITR
jgi:hypothetical protein